MASGTREVTSDPNWHYCDRLAEVTFALYSRRQTPHGTSERPAAINIGDRAFDREQLHKELLGDTRLQQQLAVQTHYMPSKWLLEQEMLARGDWPPAPLDETKASAHAGSPDAQAHPSDPPDKKAVPWPDVYRTVADEENRLFGVCLSGGGIRSATFNLGIIQGLAQLGLLPHIDYLSSVSGGGYIHEFLAGWILRERGGPDAVIQQLIPQSEPGCPPRAPEPIRWLLRYASYLTPARGMFTADTWTMVAIWLRNSILNQIPILAGLACGFFAVHLLVQQPIYEQAQFWKLPLDTSRILVHLGWTGVLAFVFGVASIFMLGRNLVRQTRMMKASGPPEDDAATEEGLSGAEGRFGKAFKRVAKRTKRKPGPETKSKLQPKPGPADLLSNSDVCFWIILPWLGCSLWFTFWSQMPREANSDLYWLPVAIPPLLIFAMVLAVIYGGGALDAYGHLNAMKLEGASTASRRVRFIWAGCLITLAALAATAVACALAYGVIRVGWWVSESFSSWAYHAWTESVRKSGGSAIWIDPWRIRLALLPGMFLSIPYFAIELALGLTGRDYPDTRREWLARLRAWSLLYAMLWIFAVTMDLLAPYVVYFVASKGFVWLYSTMATFITAHATTVLAGWSSKGDGKPSDKGFLGYKPMDLLALIAAPITILGILIYVSFGVGYAVDYLSGWLENYGTFWANLWGTELTCLAAALGIALIFGWRVDINEFSMQSFYRNRLTRCYLAATLTERQADPFTGFDDRKWVSHENVRARNLPPLLRDLLPERFGKSGTQLKGEYRGPFPIFCATLNLTTGEDLATQERKGASFAFTPLYSGYSISWTDARTGDDTSFNGFVPTSEYAYPNGGIHIDSAVAISGAALNPNQGYNSNPALAFLMTFFNVRLGWWISNPRAKRWRAGKSRPTPVVAIWYLFKELLGAVSDASDYVNLSDGGHFDNMGLYELVRRRCSYIVVCDAEADAKMNFDGMGTAIAKCRADFGAEIDLDLRPLQIDEKTGYSKTHCVVGTVRYPPPPDDMEVMAAQGMAKGGGAVRAACECLGEATEERYTGIIVYLKSSLVGDEPADLLAYKLRHDVFPQDLTANQWFAESQFESYRRLGHHIAMTALKPALPPEESSVRSRDEIGRLFERMFAIWYPRTPEMETHLAGHLKRYEEIMNELRTRLELKGLEARLNDDRTWAEAELVEWNAPLTPPESEVYALQFAHAMLEFMYTVYTNLQLAFPDNRDSPHADWWICTFRRWCRVKLVQDSWLEHVPMFPEEFRLFARRELALPPRLPYVE